jgi:hypothetical protein
MYLFDNRLHTWIFRYVHSLIEILNVQTLMHIKEVEYNMMFLFLYNNVNILKLTENRDYRSHLDLVSVALSVNISTSEVEAAIVGSQNI